MHNLPFNGFKKKKSCQTKKTNWICSWNVLTSEPSSVTRRQLFKGQRIKKERPAGSMLASSVLSCPNLCWFLLICCIQTCQVNINLHIHYPTGLFYWAWVNGLSFHRSTRLWSTLGMPHVPTVQDQFRPLRSFVSCDSNLSKPPGTCELLDSLKSPSFTL